MLAGEARRAIGTKRETNDDPRQRTQLAIANEWERMAALLGEGRDQVEYELINLLRRLDAQGPDTADV